MHRIGGDAWKVEEPHSAFTRRMKTKLGDHDYKRMRAGNAGVHHHSTTTGEATALVWPLIHVDPLTPFLRVFGHGCANFP